MEKDPEGAIAAFDEGLAHFPENGDLLQGKVVFANEFGMADVALAASKRWAEASNSSEAWYERARALQDHERTDEALAAYRRAVDVDAHNADAWINLGSLLDDRHDHADAIEAYDRALADAPDDEVAWSNKGNSLVALGRFDEAASCYSEAGAVERQRQALAYAGRVDEVRALQNKAAPRQGELREQTRDLGGRRLVARYFIGEHTNPELLDYEVGQVLDFAVSRVGIGAGIADGVTLLFHWMVVTVRERGPDLVLCEPMSGSDLNRLGDELTFTAFAAVQLFARHAVLRCDPESCNAAQRVRVQVGAIDNGRMIACRERPTDDTDSGWRLIASDGSGELEGEFVDLTVLQAFGSVVPAGLAMLPYGWRVEILDWDVARILDEHGEVKLDERRG